MTAPQLMSLFTRVPSCVDVLDNCMARFCTCPQCLKMCCRHIFHKEGEKKWKHQHTSRDLTSRSPCYYAQPAERMTSTTFQFLTGRSLTVWNPSPPSPSYRAAASARFPLTLWERTSCVYFGALIRQWSYLHPPRPFVVR